MLDVSGAVVEVAFFVIEFPDAYSFSRLVVSLVERNSILTIDGIGAVFDSVYEVCLDLDIAIGEIKEHAAVTHSVGETFGAADGEVAVELDDVLMVVGTECYGAGGSEGAHIGDYDGVEFSVIVWAE